MEKKMTALFGAAALGVLCLTPARAHFEIGTSSKSRAMMQDLEDLGEVSADERGLGEFSEFFDRSYYRNTSVSPERSRHTPVQPVTRNPAVQLWLQQNPRLAHAGRGVYYFTPPPPQIYAYGPNPFPYANGPHPILDHGYVPPPVAGYYPPPPRSGWGDGVVDFLNNMGTSFDNAREAVADWFTPDYPIRTSPIQILPGYPDYQGYPGYPPVYHAGDGRSPIGGVPRYEPGYGIVPNFGRNPDVRYEPGFGLVPGREP